MENIYLGDYAYLIEASESPSEGYGDWENLATIRILIDHVNSKLYDTEFRGFTRFTPKVVGGFRLEYVKSKKKWVVFNTKIRQPRPLDATVEFDKNGVIIKTSSKKTRIAWSPRGLISVAADIVSALEDEINKHLDEIFIKDHFNNPRNLGWHNLSLSDIKYLSDDQFRTAVQDLVDSLNEHLRISNVEAFIDKNLVIRQEGNKVGKITYDRKSMTIEINHDKKRFPWVTHAPFLSFSKIGNYIVGALE